jgi:hypothetical protein
MNFNINTNFLPWFVNQSFVSGQWSFFEPANND